MGTADGTVTPAVPHRGWIVWAAGVLTYILTVMQRTSLGDAGLEAARRFGVPPGGLAAVVVIQGAVYVAAQTPAGMLVDRFGPRLMLVVSGLLLTAGAGGAGPAPRPSPAGAGPR